MEGGSREVLARRLDWTEPGRNSGSGRRVLPTDGHRWGVARGHGCRQGPGLLTCLCHSGWRPGQGWPSPGGEFLSLGLCWWRGRCSVGKKGKSYITENQSGHNQLPLLLSTMSNGGRRRGERMLL